MWGENPHTYSNNMAVNINTVPMTAADLKFLAELRSLLNKHEQTGTISVMPEGECLLVRFAFKRGVTHGRNRA